MSKIDEFITNLQTQPCTSRITNPYVNNAHTVNNLRRYLHYLSNNPPAYMLLGDYAVHGACDLTGVPFTSNRIISDGIMPQPIGIQPQGFGPEKTATCVWSQIDRHKIPLMWHVFPWLPHQTGDITRKRQPNGYEMGQSMVLLHDLIDWFDPAQVITLGDLAKSKTTYGHNKHRFPGRQVHHIPHPRSSQRDYLASLVRALHLT